MQGKIIFFDFDKTITNEDTLLPAAYFFLKYKKNRIRYFLAAGSFIAFRIRIISEYRFKEILCTLMVKGLDEEKVYNIASRFYNENASRPFFNPAVIELLNDYKLKGDEIYLVSSNFEFLLEPLKELLPIDGIFATVSGKKGKKYSGKILGEVCSFEHKVTRTSHLLQHNSTVCYGDSKGDFMLMNACSSSFLIKHKKKSITRRIFYLFNLLLGGLSVGSEYSSSIVPFRNQY